MLASLLAAGLLPAGCLQPGGGLRPRGGLAPTMDRLVAAYDDLASRRFQVIADFEDPDQGTLFTLEPAGIPGFVGVSTEQAQRQTGVGSLKVTLSHAGQVLICSSRPDSRWGLPRDWSAYHLLLMSVHSPRQLGGFMIAARSGTALRMTYENPPLLLRPGWNLIRLDLGDMAEQLDLADLRAIEFRCDPLEAPVDLYLDDLILVDNTRELYATPERQPGDLYARTAGRRLIVGAIDRFELTFSRGRIRRWFDLGFDRTRIHNLVGIGSLGPDPLPVSGNQPAVQAAQESASWLVAGTTLETYQSLLSASPLCVVVQGEWRFTPPGTVPSDSDPCHRWLYSIYGDGRVYVACTGTFPPDHPADRVALSFCCDAGAGFRRQIACASQPAGVAPAIPATDDYLLFSRSGKGQADLLVVPSRGVVAYDVADLGSSRSCGSWVIDADNGRFSFAAMMRVWPPDIDSPEQAAPMAADYRHPLPLHLDAGQLVRTDPGDFDNDGFSEARGYYLLQLDGHIAKVRIDGVQNLRFSPVFKLVDVANRDVWAYLDGRQIRGAVRDEDNNILFMIPGTLSREVLLEITSQPVTAR